MRRKIATYQCAVELGTEAGNVLGPEAVMEIIAISPEILRIGRTQERAKKTHHRPVRCCDTGGSGSGKPLFDVGREATIRLTQVGIAIGTINAVFLRHFHDHTSGSPDLWLTGWIGRYYGNRQKPFRIILIKPAYGYRVDCDGRSVIISGDTRYSQNLEKYAHGATLVIHEVAIN